MSALRQVEGGFVRADCHGEVGKPLLEDVQAEHGQLAAEYERMRESVDVLRGELGRVARFILKLADDAYARELDCSDELFAEADRIRCGTSTAQDEARALEEALAVAHGRAA